MIKGKNIIGNRYGKLTVISYDTNRYYLCSCDCGNTKSIRRDKLLNGMTKSCGCIKTGRKNLHGDSHTRLYGIYSHIKDRCYNKNHIHYKNYGGRGIIMCNEWKKDYLIFKKWALENGYSDSLSIDRIDVNGNYEPANCRWATVEEQSNNKRTSCYLQYNGEIKTIAQWSKKLNMPRHRIINNKMFTKVNV